MIPNRRRSIATIAALLLVTSVIVPAVGAAADSSLTMTVEQQPETGNALVSVTQNGNPVENGTLLVNASGNYSANDSYTLDSNGTVTLPAPNETVDVELAVEYDNATVTETTSLVPLRDSLHVDVEQHNDGSATASVSQYGESVPNATVTVEAATNETYAGAGNYTTDQNGTIALPHPESSVRVTITAEYANVTASESRSLSGSNLTVSVSQDAAGAVTITVLDGQEYVDGATTTVESETYSYGGSYTAENGTVSLPAPTQNVTIQVTATAANETATTTAELVEPRDENPHNDFAESLGRFINFLKTTGVDGPLGHEISAFVHEHNPASNDSHHGPPAHSNGDDKTNAESDAPGQSAVANGQNDSNVEDRHESPDHANGYEETSRDRDRVHVENQTDSDGGESEVDVATDERVNGDDSPEVDRKDVKDDDRESDGDAKTRHGQPDHANGR